MVIAFCTGFAFLQVTTPSGEPLKVSETEQANNPIKPLLSADQVFGQYIENTYAAAGLADQGLSLETFRKAVTGYHNLMSANRLSSEKSLITIVDFNQSSRNRRLWVIDLSTNQVVYNTWVAHGQGSGLEYASTFSNTVNSFQSSLGFYLTEDTYMGKNGYSLKLQGLDAGFNTNALDRSVVVHGAPYASEGFIKATGRLGRSQGCPALPTELNKPIINTIKGRTLLFVDGPSDSYSSAYLDSGQAATCFVNDEAGKNHINA
ncbi:hypothetical protein TH61_05450 [Rufibacter sp. DG15C]|nr:hypothetical protein TH61_05450 [Rufibacter sp. DG15C]